MSKQQLIEQIRELNRSAPQEFLVSFNLETLEAYLKRLALARHGRGRNSIWVRQGSCPAVVGHAR